MGGIVLSTIYQPKIPEGTYGTASYGMPFQDLKYCCPEKATVVGVDYFNNTVDIELASDSTQFTGVKYLCHTDIDYYSYITNGLAIPEDPNEVFSHTAQCFIWKSGADNIVTALVVRLPAELGGTVTCTVAIPYRENIGDPCKGATYWLYLYFYIISIADDGSQAYKIVIYDVFRNKVADIVNNAGTDLVQFPAVDADVSAWESNYVEWSSVGVDDPDFFTYEVPTIALVTRDAVRFDAAPADPSTSYSDVALDDGSDFRYDFSQRDYHDGAYHEFDGSGNVDNNNAWTDYFCYLDFFGSNHLSVIPLSSWSSPFTYTAFCFGVEIFTVTMEAHGSRTNWPGPPYSPAFDNNSIMLSFSGAVSKSLEYKSNTSRSDDGSITYNTTYQCNFYGHTGGAATPYYGANAAAWAHTQTPTTTNLFFGYGALAVPHTYSEDTYHRVTNSLGAIEEESYTYGRMHPNYKIWVTTCVTDDHETEFPQNFTALDNSEVVLDEVLGHQRMYESGVVDSLDKRSVIYDIKFRVARFDNRIRAF